MLALMPVIGQLIVILNPDWLNQKNISALFFTLKSSVPSVEIYWRAKAG